MKEIIIVELLARLRYATLGNCLCKSCKDARALNEKLKKERSGRT